MTKIQKVWVSGCILNCQEFCQCHWWHSTTPRTCWMIFASPLDSFECIGGRSHSKPWMDWTDIGKILRLWTQEESNGIYHEHSWYWKMRTSIF